MAEPPELPRDTKIPEKIQTIDPSATGNIQPSEIDLPSAETPDAESGGAASDEEEEEEEDDEEPRLKYTRLTKSLGSVYRNGDAVSCSLVFGERMVNFNALIPSV